jgi:hypothetical protein
MKKIAFLLLFGLLTISCQEKIHEAFKLKEKDNIGENSKIYEVEQSGTVLFKKEVTVFDATKANTITLLVASPIEKDLNDYLKNMIFTLNVFEDISEVKLEKDPQGNTAPSKTVEQPTNVKYKEIYIETISKKFESGKSIYSLNFRTNFKNLRPELKYGPWEYKTWHSSNLFDDWITVTRRSVGGPTVLENSIKIEFQYRNCGLCGWRNDWGKNTTIYEWSSPQYATSNVDARQLGADVFHNNYGNYSVVCGN